MAHGYDREGRPIWYGTYPEPERVIEDEIHAHTEDNEPSGGYIIPPGLDVTSAKPYYESTEKRLRGLSELVLGVFLLQIFVIFATILGLTLLWSRYYL
jgi:hypothetical protein